VSRLIAGSNPISGFSHASQDRSDEMVNYFSVANAKRHLAACERHGITAVVARGDPFIARLLREYWNEGGRIHWIGQTAPEHRDLRRNIELLRRSGASAIFVHGSTVDALVESRDLDTLARALDVIDQMGLPGGLAAHSPANLLECQTRSLAVSFYLVCLYRIEGYRGRSGTEPRETFNDTDRADALNILRQLRAPCLAYKVLAAGRKRADEGFRDVVPALQPKDGVIVGMFPPDCRSIVAHNVRVFRQTVLTTREPEPCT
jgi:hypothetical protein